MKKLCLFLVLGMIMFSSSAFAITQEELEVTKLTIREIQTVLREMSIAVNIAIKGKFSSIDLTAEQINILIQRYNTKKSELSELYQELP